MSNEILNLVWGIGITPTQKLVMLCLADHANSKTQACFPSVATISRRTSLSARTVQKAIKALNGQGLIGRTEVKGRKVNYTFYISESPSAAAAGSPPNKMSQNANVVRFPSERGSPETEIANINLRAEDSSSETIRLALEKRRPTFFSFSRSCIFEVEGKQLIIRGSPFAIARLRSEFGNDLLDQSIDELGAAAEIKWIEVLPPRKSGSA